MIAGILALCCLLVLTFLRVPIGIALLLVGFGGSVLFQGFSASVIQLQLTIWDMADNFLLVALPLFIWMGQLANVGELGLDLYKGCRVIFGRVRGGLGATAIVSSAAMGATSSSSVATLMTMGKMLLPEMLKAHYSRSVATGSLASAGILAILIPPSIPLVFYSAWTETSLADLFIAAIIPGLLLTLLFTTFVLLRTTHSPLTTAQPSYGLVEKIKALRYLLPFSVLLALILGSIYSGIATASEAAAVGTLVSLVIALIKGKLTFERFRQSVSETAMYSANIFMLILGGMLFSRFLVQTGLIESLIGNIGHWELSRYEVIIALVLMYLLLGAFLDVFSLLILPLPFVFPLVTSLGYDPVWLGIFLVVMIELALITPPIGLHVFLIQRLCPDMHLREVFAGTAPYVALTLLMAGLLIAFPEVALWLPAQMR